MTRPIRYTIVPARPEAHLYRVTCTVEDPDPSGQRFALPAWIPGSYMIREFARHVVSIRAVAVEGLRPGQTGLDSVLAKRRAGERLTIHAFRRDELMSFEVRLKRAEADTCVLAESPGARRRLLERWLGTRGG